MATVVVSGRIDEKVRDRAAAYIHAAGLTPGDVIKTVWEGIARTGMLPDMGEREGDDSSAQDPWQAFMDLRARRPETRKNLEWLSDASPRQLKDYLAEERLGSHERLQ